VRLSDAFHLSGHRAVELKDVPGDSDFPELQGYFPCRAPDGSTSTSPS
jgi:hypothetical protein